jgi:hypothetical protein
MRISIFNGIQKPSHGGNVGWGHAALNFKPDHARRISFADRV